MSKRNQSPEQRIERPPSQPPVTAGNRLESLLGCSRGACREPYHKRPHAMRRHQRPRRATKRRIHITGSLLSLGQEQAEVFALRKARRGSGGLARATDLWCPVSKSPRMSRNSSKPNGFGIDCMEHYKHIISELLRGKEGTFSTRVMKGVQSVVAQNNGKAGQDSLPLFTETIRDLSKCDMESLKHALHEVSTILNDDVDEILGHILAISEFGSEKLLSSHASGSYEDRIAPARAKKQKTVTVSIPDAHEKVHGHISSGIFEQLIRGIQGIEESGETRQEAVKKFSDGLLQKLGKLAQSVDDLLDTVVSMCRSMTTAEKLELSMRIRKLPEKALDRMVEIVKLRRPESQSSDEVSINLGRLDDGTLWRLYYYVETVLKAKQNLTTTSPHMFHGQ